jgi:hypothetical protein
VALDNLERYAFADPASGKQKVKKIRARQAIVVIGIDHLLRIFVLFAWAGRYVTSRFRDKILDTIERFSPRRFGIEANAMQELFGDEVIERAKERFGSARGLVSVPQPTKIEKDFRIRTTIEPILNDGRLFVNPSQVELISELRGFPTAATKDLVDALASAITLIPRRPPSVRHNAEADALADYLRRSGAPGWYIEQRVSELGAVNVNTQI